MNKQQIIFYTHGHFNEDCLKNITEAVFHEFKCPVSIKCFESDLELFYDQERRQYDGNKILNVIHEFEVPENIKKVGLFQVDLFIPILTFIFGQAIYKGSAGVVSCYRLKNEQYGLEPDFNLLFTRFKKVIIHEIGHLFGLKHCYVPNCVMRSSTYVEDIDQKNEHFCTQCKQELQDLMAAL